MIRKNRGKGKNVFTFVVAWIDPFNKRVNLIE